jgi:hypothetical protein
MPRYLIEGSFSREGLEGEATKTAIPYRPPGQ